MFEGCKNSKEIHQEIMRFLNDPNDYFFPAPTWAMGNLRTIFEFNNLTYNIQYDDLQNIASVMYEKALIKYANFPKDDNPLPTLPQIPENMNPIERLTRLADFLISINKQEKPQPQRNSGEEKTRKRKKLGKIASLIYEKLLTLPEHRAMPLPDIVTWLWEEHEINLADSTVYQKHIKQLEPWGLQHDPRIGYSIIRDIKV